MSMRKLTITLTDDEYAALEAEAGRERRTVRQQAEYRITRQSLFPHPPNPSVVTWSPGVIGGITYTPPPSGTTYGKLGD